MISLGVSVFLRPSVSSAPQLCVCAWPHCPQGVRNLRASANIESVSGYFVENFGCRATQADGAALERQFEERGLVRAATAREAELVVLNTCTVTAAADQDARAAIRRVQQQ